MKKAVLSVFPVLFCTCLLFLQCGREKSDMGRQLHVFKFQVASLADEFGLEAVRNWRFGVVTEYENRDWFSVDDDPVQTRNAYFALYDYTVDALEQVLGDNA